MSVVLLTTPPWVLDSLRTRAPEASVIPGTTAILTTCAAAVCRATLESIYSKHPLGVPEGRGAPTEHALGGGYILRVTTHQAAVIGPPTFLDVTNSAYDCPWGLWVLYKGKSGFVDVEIISMIDAIDAYYLARTFTHTYSSHNLNVAKRMHYYTGDEAIRKLKEKAHSLARLRAVSTSTAWD